MALDLRCSQALLGISFHHSFKNVLAVAAEIFGHLEFTGKNLLVEFASVFVFEGEETRKHSEENDAWGPYVDAAAIVEFAFDHFGCGVAGTSTRCF